MSYSQPTLIPLLLSLGCRYRQAHAEGLFDESPEVFFPVTADPIKRGKKRRREMREKNRVVAAKLAVKTEILIGRRELMGENKTEKSRVRSMKIMRYK